jgi:hypothetical protein
MPSGLTPRGPISALALTPTSTSAGTINPPARAIAEMSRDDIVNLAILAALKGDGKFTLSYAQSAAGVTLTVTQNARAVTIGPFPFVPERLNEAIDYVNRELKLRANV